MFIFTEQGHTINTDCLKSISWCKLPENPEVISNSNYLVKATGMENEVYYLDRFEKEAKATLYIRDLTNQINGETKGLRRLKNA